MTNKLAKLGLSALLSATTSCATLQDLKGVAGRCVEDIRYGNVFAREGRYNTNAMQGITNESFTNRDFNSYAHIIPIGNNEYTPIRLTGHKVTIDGKEISKDNYVQFALVNREIMDEITDRNAKTHIYTGADGSILLPEIDPRICELNTGIVAHRRNLPRGRRIAKVPHSDFSVNLIYDMKMDGYENVVFGNDKDNGDILMTTSRRTRIKHRPGKPSFISFMNTDDRSTMYRINPNAKIQLEGTFTPTDVIQFDVIEY